MLYNISKINNIEGGLIVDFYSYPRKKIQLCDNDRQVLVQYSKIYHEYFMISSNADKKLLNSNQKSASTKIKDKHTE